MKGVVCARGDVCERGGPCAICAEYFVCVNNNLFSNVLYFFVVRSVT